MIENIIFMLVFILFWPIMLASYVEVSNDAMYVAMIINIFWLIFLVILPSLVNKNEHY